MDDRFRHALRDLNRRFYDLRAEPFSRSRERPWQGWRRVIDRLQPTSAEPLRVLDAGCGNGRFGVYLADRRPGPWRYVGLDACAALLRIADRRLAGQAADLRQVDVLDADFGEVLPCERFDLVALFGVLHHVPGHAARRDLLVRLAALLAPGGVLAASVWRLDRGPRFDRLVVPWESFRPGGEPVDPAELEPGDTLLSWGGDAAHPRYCHFPEDAEIDAWIDALQPPLIDRYRADGASGRDNLYLLFRANLRSR